MNNIKVTSKVGNYLVIGGTVIQSYGTEDINLDVLTERDIKNLRYLWRLDNVALTTEAVTAMNSKLFGIAGYDGVLETYASASIDSLAEQLQMVQIDVATLKSNATNYATKTSVASTDVIKEGTANLYHSEAKVRAVKLDTVTGTNTAIVVNDTVATAFGKLQAQITALSSRVAVLESK